MEVHIRECVRPPREISGHPGDRSKAPTLGYKTHTT